LQYPRPTDVCAGSLYFDKFEQSPELCWRFYTSNHTISHHVISRTHSGL